MAKSKELKSAKDVFKLICKFLDKNEWKYKVDKDKLIISFGLRGEDIPMDFTIQVDADRQLIRLLSFMPFKVNKDKIVECAIATSYANYCMADGSFDFNITDGTIVFRMTASFKSSIISADLIDYMIGCSSYTVDHYNDKFLMLSKGVISVEDFFEKKD